MIAKLKSVLKFLLVAAGVLALLVYVDSQNIETRMLFGIAALILYLAYLANQRINQFTKDKFYSCIFEKQVIAVDSDDVVASLEIKCKLPFVPFIGLEVVDCLNPMPEECDDADKHDFQEFYSGKITRVVWRYSRFVCEVTPHKMSRKNKLEEIIIEHSQYAWKLDGLFFREREIVLDYIEKSLSKFKDAEDASADRKRHRLEIAKKRLQR